MVKAELERMFTNALVSVEACGPDAAGNQDTGQGSAGPQPFRRQDVFL